MSAVRFLLFEKDLQQYGLMEVVGVQQHQIIQMMFRQMMKVVLTGSLAGVVIGSLVVLGVLPAVIGKLYLGQAEELEGISFYQPVFRPANYFLRSALCSPRIHSGKRPYFLYPGKFPSVCCRLPE